MKNKPFFLVNFHATSLKFLFILFITLVSSFAYSQKNGIVSGKIIDKATGETMIGATIQLEATEIGASTDIEGNFKLSAAPGTYKLSVRYFGYETAIIDVEIKSNEVLALEYAMEEAKALDLKEVVVVATAEQSSEVVMYIGLKKAAIISSGITASEIRRTPDRTVGDILKRVTGASIQEGKFAIIRGMNDRYNAGYLDGAYLSSTESDRKAFAFDVVPANLIDNLMIVKAGTPDLTGDFGGGVILINTKSVPDRLTQNLTIGAQYHSLTTFNEFKESKTYPGEALNFLSSQRDIPKFDEGALKISSTFPTQEDKERLGPISQNFNNDWSTKTLTAVPNARLAYSIGFPIQLRNSNKMGVILALNYSNTRRFSESNINSFDGAGQVAAYADKSFVRNITSGGIFNVNYVGTHTQINFRNLLNINTDNNTILRSGTGSFQDALTVQNTANLLSYNRLYNGILSLKQLVGDSILSINASGSYSNVHREVPDFRIASYTKSPDFPDYRLALGDFFNSSTGRFSSSLNENLYSGTFELNKKFETGSLRSDLKAGYFYQGRERTFAGRSFVYSGNPGESSLDPSIALGSGNIGTTKLFLIEKSSDDISYYEGKSILNAYYISVDQNLANTFRAVYGVRFENNDLSVNNQRIKSTIANIKEMAILPSVNLTYYLNQKTNLRASYFGSVNRPEFRELAPFAFYVFDKNAEIRGNEALKVATLKNFDFRYEFYPQGGQMISIGGFYKHIDDPIELSLDITQPFSTFTYQNEKSANIFGLEFELKKKLDFIGSSGFFQNLSIYSNVSLIKSQLNFKEGSQAKKDRPLQGQSPYIINARLQYESLDNGWSWNIAVNRVGRRIAFVGVDPKYGDTRQDIYEAPRTVVDMQVGKTIKNLNIKLTVGDLLHHNLIYYQDTDQDGKYRKDSNDPSDRVLYSFTNGFTTSLSLGYTF